MTLPSKEFACKPFSEIGILFWYIDYYDNLIMYPNGFYIIDYDR